MNEKIKRVSLVVDKNYGERLRSLVGNGPVWLIDTEPNRMAAAAYWQLHPKPKGGATVTTFKYSADDSPSSVCLKILDAIDLHHGKYSGDYSILEVIGTPIDEELRSAIADLGFNGFDATAEGFCASR